MSGDKDLIKQLVAQMEKAFKDFTKHPSAMRHDFYVNRVLQIFAEVEQKMEIRDATVDEQALVGDFFMCWWQNDVAEQFTVLAALKSKLGFAVSFDDSLISVATKLKN